MKNHHTQASALAGLFLAAALAGAQAGPVRQDPGTGKTEPMITQEEREIHRQINTLVHMWTSESAPYNYTLQIQYSENGGKTLTLSDRNGQDCEQSYHANNGTSNYSAFQCGRIAFHTTSVGKNDPSHVLRLDIDRIENIKKIYSDRFMADQQPVYQQDNACDITTTGKNDPSGQTVELDCTKAVIGLHQDLAITFLAYMHNITNPGESTGSDSSEENKMPSRTPEGP